MDRQAPFLKTGQSSPVLNLDELTTEYVPEPGHHDSKAPLGQAVLYCRGPPRTPPLLPPYTAARPREPDAPFYRPDAETKDSDKGPFPKQGNPGWPLRAVVEMSCVPFIEALP